MNEKSRIEEAQAALVRRNGAAHPAADQFIFQCDCGCRFKALTAGDVTKARKKIAPSDLPNQQIADAINSYMSATVNGEELKRGWERFQASQRWPHVSQFSWNAALIKWQRLIPRVHRRPTWGKTRAKSKAAKKAVVKKFIASCQKNSELRTKKSLLYLAFVDFCNAQGIRLRSQNWFTQEAKKLGIKQTRYEWIGLGLPEKAEEPSEMPQPVERPEPIPSEEPKPTLPGETIGDKSHILLSQRIAEIYSILQILDKETTDHFKQVEDNLYDLRQRMSQQEDSLALHALKHDIRERSKGPSKLTRFHRAVRQRIKFVVTGR